MAYDRVERFLSKADWTSLFTPKPAPQKPTVRRLATRRVTFEDTKDATAFPHDHTTDEEIDMKAKMLEIEQRKAKYAALRARLKSLSQPKPMTRTNKGGENWDDIDVGPADYDTRLDIAKPSFLSTRPNNPAPKIRKLTGGSRLTSPGRDATFHVHPRLVTKSETPTTQPSGKLTPKRSSSMCKSRRLKKAEKMSGSFGGRKRSLCRESDSSQRLEFMGVVIFPDIRNYTPTPIETHKGKYSIPKSQKRFNIRKCNRYTDSVANQRFNTMFSP